MDRSSRPVHEHRRGVDESDGRSRSDAVRHRGSSPGRAGVPVAGRGRLVTSAEISTDRGRPIQGPTALGSNPRRLWPLAGVMALTDFRLKFFGSVLGYLWQLMRPLMLFTVLYVVFSVLLNFQGTERFFAVGLLLGVVLFAFFSEATSESVSSLIKRESLVRKVDFPRLAVPLASILTALFNLMLNLVPVFGFLLIAGGVPRWTWLELPVLILLLAVLTLGLGMLLSALFVRYRDIAPIWDVVLQITFYVSAILYPLSLVRQQGNE